MDRHRRRALVLVTAVAVTALVAVSCSSGSTKAQTSGTGANVTTSAATGVTGPTTTVKSSDGKVVVTTLSAPAPYLSGGDVLLEVTSTGAKPQVSVNGTSTTVPWTAVGEASAHTWSGLVAGLTNGSSTLKVSAGGSTATLPVVNHPLQGPVFSGPHQTPFACTTKDAGLGSASPPNCVAPTKVTFHYITTAGDLKDLDDPTAKPADIATETVDGTPVPAIVREESGVIDRSIYQISALDPNPTLTEPKSPDPSLDPGGKAWDSSGWNHRLVYRYGGGCGVSYSQGSSDAGVLDATLLAKGYALATSSLNTFQTACNATLSAEATMMVKQHFIDEYGDPMYTIGDGGSGGAIQQLQIAQNYPGLLDALSPELPFPDSISISGGVSDCELLNQYYAGGGASLTTAQQTAINGHATPRTCVLWASTFGKNVDPANCGDSVPSDQVYNASTNPKGVQCTLQAGNVNELGIDPSTGMPNRPLDNVGVQYGLDALNAGTITVDQFLDLNQKVGGYDKNGKVVDQRTTASANSLAQVYAKGGVDEGGPLWNLPIIVTNPYDDPSGDIHDSFRKFSIRDRLTKPNGTTDPNLLIWTVPSQGISGAELLGSIEGTATGIELLDQWLTAAHTRPTDPNASAKLAANKPGAAVDTCTLPDGTKMASATVYQGSNACTQAYPLHGDPRTAAGAPQRNDILKCQLMPVSRAQYKVSFTTAQQQQLAKIFPTGVCDWSKKGVGQVPLVGTWISYGN
jgi:hypothetical protein